MKTNIQTAAYEMVIAYMSAMLAIYSFRDHCSADGWIWSVCAVVYLLEFIFSLCMLRWTRRDRRVSCR
jgi:hypothetical protein